jgi:uncharacterized protein
MIALCFHWPAPPFVRQVSAATETHEPENSQRESQDVASAAPSNSKVPDVGRHRVVRSLLEIRRERTVVQRWDLSCGAAGLATLLAYQHGDFVSERDIASGLIRRKEYIAHPELVRIRQGFSFLDLKRYVDQRGYTGSGYGQLALKDLIERAPILVPVNFSGYNHFVVFRGMQGNRVLLSDPAWGNRTMQREKFESAWIAYPEIGKVGFAVSRRDGTTAPNNLAARPRDFVMLQ